MWSVGGRRVRGNSTQREEDLIVLAESLSSNAIADNSKIAAATMYYYHYPKCDRTRYVETPKPKPKPKEKEEETDDNQK